MADGAGRLAALSGQFRPGCPDGRTSVESPPIRVVASPSATADGMTAAADSRAARHSATARSTYSRGGDEQHGLARSGGRIVHEVVDQVFDFGAEFRLGLEPEHIRPRGPVGHRKFLGRHQEPSRRQPDHRVARGDALFAEELREGLADFVRLIQAGARRIDELRNMPDLGAVPATTSATSIDRSPIARPNAFL